MSYHMILKKDQRILNTSQYIVNIFFFLTPKDVAELSKKGKNSKNGQNNLNNL